MNHSSRWPWLLKSQLSISSRTGLTLVWKRISYNLSQIILSFFIFFCSPKSMVNTHVHLILKLQIFSLTLDMPCCPHFRTWSRTGFYFWKPPAPGRKLIYLYPRIMFPIKINHNLKLHKLQYLPAFHPSRRIELSLWYRQINRGKVNYWLAQKILNGQTENYTFEKCYDVQAILKMFLCPKEGTVQVQTKCGRSYCTGLVQCLRIMMPHILKITIIFHSLCLSLRPCPKVKSDTLQTRRPDFAAGSGSFIKLPDRMRMLSVFFFQLGSQSVCC